MSLESLYHETSALLQQTQNFFVRLEQGGPAGEHADQLQTEIQVMLSAEYNIVMPCCVQCRLETLWSNAGRLDLLAGKEPAARRQAARQRVEQLKYDMQHLSAALQSLVNRAELRARQESNRQQLLNTQFTTNEASNSSETAILMERALSHQDSLTRSNQYMTDMLDQGASILENLREQRGVMKSAQKKMLDVFNTLGMSNTVIRLIERRAEGDRYILIGGILLTCVFMWIIIRLFT